MAEMPANEYVEVRNGGYYVRGTRIPIDVFVYAYRRGKTAEAILDAYPSIGSLATVNAVITLLVEQPRLVDHYMQHQSALWDRFRQKHPMPQHVLDGFERARKELERRSA